MPSKVSNRKQLTFMCEDVKYTKIVYDLKSPPKREHWLPPTRTDDNRKRKEINAGRKKKSWDKRGSRGWGGRLICSMTLPPGGDLRDSRVRAQNWPHDVTICLYDATQIKGRQIKSESLDISEQLILLSIVFYFGEFPFLFLNIELLCCHRDIHVKCSLLNMIIILILIIISSSNRNI